MVSYVFRNSSKQSFRICNVNQAMAVILEVDV